MGNFQPRLEMPRQRMVRRPRVVEDAKALLVQGVAWDAIEVKDGSVSGKTGQHGRRDVVRGPIEDLRQAVPVCLRPEIGSARLGSGDDQGVELAAPKIVDIGITAAQILAALL